MGRWNLFHVVILLSQSLKKAIDMKTSKNKLVSFLILIMLLVSTGVSLAHCDTMDGPLVKDAQKALSQNNVNIVLKWIPANDEAELKDAFIQTLKVRSLSSDAEKLADKSFFETLVRIHRAGEGVPFTGVKPSGTPIDEKILAADKAIELGNLTPFEGLVPQKEKAELTQLFNHVQSLKKFDVTNVEAGRKYIAAYVQFFKFAEGESHEGAAVHSDHKAHIPWVLSIFFLITTTVFASLYLKKKNG